MIFALVSFVGVSLAFAICDGRLLGRILRLSVVGGNDSDDNRGENQNGDDNAIDNLGCQRLLAEADFLFHFLCLPFKFAVARSILFPKRKFYTPKEMLLKKPLTKREEYAKIEKTKGARDGISLA